MAIYESRKESYYDFEGVRIKPAELHFRDVYENPVKLTFTIQNLKHAPVVIRIQEPLSMGFKMGTKIFEVKLCPGMTISKQVKYLGLKDTVLRSSLSVYVNGVLWSYPVKVTKAEGCVKVDPQEVNFGILDVGQSVVSRTIKLNNKGALSSRFAFDLGTNELDLVVYPLRGMVYEKSSTTVTFEFMALQAGYFSCECWLRVSPEAIRIPIQVMVYMPRLDVRHPNSVGDFTLLDFPPTYFKAEFSQAIIIHNVCATTTFFIILAEINNQLLPIQEARKINPAFNMFDMNPYEGRMQSFEGRICTAIFQPKVEHDLTGLKHLTHTSSTEDYFVFLQVIRVQCLPKVEIEKLIQNRDREDNLLMDDSGLITTFENLPSFCSKGKFEVPKQRKIVRRICLHGTAIYPDFVVEPSELLLGSLAVKEVGRRVLSLHNRCAQRPLNFSLKHTTCVKVEPSSGRIGAHRKLEVLVIVRPSYLGLVKNKIVFVLSTRIQDGSLREIGSKVVPISWKGVQEKHLPQPKFNMGITPILTNEVGTFTDNVTFRSAVEKPRAAVLRADMSKKRYWFPRKGEFPMSERGDNAENVARLIRTEAHHISKLQKVGSRATPVHYVRIYSDTVQSDTNIKHETLSITSESGRESARSSGARTPPAIHISDTKVISCSSLLGDELNSKARDEKSWISNKVKELLQFVIEESARNETKKNELHPSNDLIAFPNDRPRSLRPWPKDKQIRTIFTGKTRYSPPQDARYSFTSEQQQSHAAAADQQLQFLRKRQKIRSLKEERRVQSAPEYEGHSSKFLYKLQPTYQEDSTKLAMPCGEFVPLTPLQLYNVKIEPRTINFGKIAPNSKICERLRLENLNTFPVVVQMIPGTRGVELPDGDRRVIPAECSSVLKMSFTPYTLGRYNGFLVYVINNSHTFEVTLRAEVVLKCFFLSPTSLEFNAASKFLDVSITNKLQTEGQFTWVVPANSPFSVKPMTGTVPPLCHIQCAVTHNLLTSQQKAHADLKLLSESGTYQFLKCSAAAKKPSNVSFSPVRIDLGNIPLNLHVTGFTLLLNDSQQDYTFKLKTMKNFPGMFVFPNNGVLRARSCIAINVHCQIPHVIEFTRDIKMDIQNSKTLTFSVSAKVCYPEVTVLPATIHLRGVPAGSVEVTPIQLRNTSVTTASVEFDIDDRPELCLSYSADLSNLRNTDTCVIAPGSGVTMYLHFRPNEIAAHKLILPIILNGLLGPATMENAATQAPAYFLGTEKIHFDAKVKPQNIPKNMPMVRVDCTVIGYILQFSANYLKFRYFPNSRKNKILDKIDVSNNASEIVTFSLCISDLKDPFTSFRAVWPTYTDKVENKETIEFTLKPKESTSFIFLFNPLQPGNYTASIPIHVNNYSTEKIFNIISLEGKYLAPVLWPSTDQIFFIPSPLNVASHQYIMLYALNYSVPDEVTAEIDEKWRENLHISFARDNVIPASNEWHELLVKISFSSKNQTSFKAEVTFLDMHYRSCSVQVTASADNSLLTSYIFTKCGPDLPEECGEAKIKTCFSTLKNALHRSLDELDNLTATAQSSDALTNVSELELSVNMPKESDTRTKLNGSQTAFPMFPCGEEDTEKACFLRSTVEAVECWLYKQGFNNTFAPTLPQDMTLMLSSMPMLKKRKGRGKVGIHSKTIFNVVGKLGGPRVAKVFQVTALPEDEYEFVLLLHDLYSKLLIFLTDQGACLAHVNPLFLLSYQEYLLYMRQEQQSKKSENGPSERSKKLTTGMLEQRVFECFAKQAWLDVVLQIYKTMVLVRVVINPDIQIKKESTRLDVAGKLEDELTLPDVDVKTSAPSLVYSSAASILLNWLSAHFNKQRDSVWTKTSDEKFNGGSTAQKVPEPREIRDFESDLADGLVFAAVTASYCPYLVPLFLSNMYTEPIQSEQMYHNAIRVCLAWQSVDLGFVISPDDIVKPNCIKMLMLTVHLYETLPMFCPRTKLRFETELNSQTTQRVTLTNPCGKRLKYGVLFIGEDQTCFLASKTCIVLPAHESSSVEISYTARRIAPVGATLILSGCIYPPYYGRTMTFQLEGHASNLKPAQQLNVRLPIYTPKFMQLYFQSPYDKPGVWDIHVSENKPEATGTFDPVLWRDQCTRKVPRRLYIHTKDLSIDKDSRASLDVTIACLSPTVRSYWLVFLNDTLGDFIIMLTVEPLGLQKPARIHVPLSEDNECRCGQQETPPNLEQGNFCPLAVAAPLPCRNEALWTAVLTMFKLVMDDRERNVWERYLETIIGVKLMKWLLGDIYDSVTDEIIHIFNKTVKYNLSCNDDINMPKTFTISDVWEQGTVALPVHASSKMQDGSIVNVTLTSEDKKEIRAYSLVFAPRENHC